MNNHSRLLYSLDGNFSVRRKSSVYVTWFPAYCLAILNLRAIAYKTNPEQDRWNHGGLQIWMIFRYVLDINKISLQPKFQCPTINGYVVIAI